LVLCPSKFIILYLFLPQNRPMPEKFGLTVYSISHDSLIFAHRWGSGWEQRMGGKPLYVSTKQDESPFTAKT
jgi:hypothetical protein